MYTRYLLFWLISYCFVHSPAYADCPTPQYPNVYNVTYQSAYLNWSASYSGSAPTYQVQWRVASDQTWMTKAATSAALSLTGLTNATTYEWRVRSICAAGDTSAYIVGAAFQTKCDQPTYPNVSNVTYESAQLSWNPLVSGASYEVQWRAVGAATWTVVSSITASSLRLTGLPDQTLFEWQVRTVCSGTITSDFASGPVFQTRCLAPTYVRTALINPVANVSNDLQWRPVGSSTWTLVEGITTNEYSPAVWSCNRLPTVMDAVQVKHAITIQTNSTAKMLSIRYEAGGQLVVGAGATVQMGK